MTLWFLFYLNILMNFPQRPNLNNIFRLILFILYSCNFYWYKLINYLNITTKIRYFDLEWLINEISFYILFKLHMIEPIFLIQSTPELFYVTHSFLNIYAYLFILLLGDQLRLWTRAFLMVILTLVFIYTEFNRIFLIFHLISFFNKG